MKPEQGAPAFFLASYKSWPVYERVGDSPNRATSVLPTPTVFLPRSSNRERFTDE